MNIVQWYLIFQLITFLIEIGLLVNNDEKYNNVWIDDFLKLLKETESSECKSFILTLILLWILPTIFIFYILGKIGKGIYLIRDKIKESKTKKKFQIQKIK